MVFGEFRVLHGSQSRIGAVSADVEPHTDERTYNQCIQTTLMCIRLRHRVMHGSISTLMPLAVIKGAGLLFGD